MASQTQTTLNLNETALLGLLADKARYGYELDKIIKEKHMRGWTDIAFSSIYAILKGLEDKGCVVSSSEIAGNRVRRHYSISRQGRKILRASTANLLSEPSKTSDSLMAGLANMNQLSDEEIRNALTMRAEALRRQLSLVEHIEKDKRGKDKAYFTALAGRTRGRVNEELRFVAELLGSAKEAKEVPEAKAPKSAPSVAEKEDSQLIEQPAKGAEEEKETLF